MVGVVDGAASSAGTSTRQVEAMEGYPTFRGWAGGVDELEGLVAAGPGRLEARIMEAVWTYGEVRRSRSPRGSGSRARDSS